MKLVPDSNGEAVEDLREFNSCHRKADGKFGGKADCGAVRDRFAPAQPLTSKTKAILNMLDVISASVPGSPPRAVKPGALGGPDAFLGKMGPEHTSVYPVRNPIGGARKPRMKKMPGGTADVRAPGQPVAAGRLPGEPFQGAQKLGEIDLSVPATDPVTKHSTAPLTSGKKATSLDYAGGGCNGSYKLVLETRSGEKLTVQFKPEDEENEGGREAILNGTMSLAEREVAAWEVDRILGNNLVPVHAMAKIDGRRGCVHEWYGPAQPQGNIGWGDPGTWGMTNDRLLQFAVLDTIIGNLDRHPNNWLVENGTGRPIAIDHGYAFPAAGSHKDNEYHHRDDPLGASEMRSYPVQYFIDRSSSAMIGSAAEKKRLLKVVKNTNWSKFLDKHSFSPDERRALMNRVDLVVNGLQAGTLHKVLDEAVNKHWSGWSW